MSISFFPFIASLSYNAILFYYSCQSQRFHILSSSSSVHQQQHHYRQYQRCQRQQDNILCLYTQTFIVFTVSFRWDELPHIEARINEELNEWMNARTKNDAASSSDSSAPLYAVVVVSICLTVYFCLCCCCCCRCYCYCLQKYVCVCVCVYENASVLTEL